MFEITPACIYNVQTRFWNDHAGLDEQKVVLKKEIAGIYQSIPPNQTTPSDIKLDSVTLPCIELYTYYSAVYYNNLRKRKEY